MDPTIIFEDKHLLIIDKPSGWVVNEAETTKHQNVVQGWLKNMSYPLAKIPGMRSGIVHRLDKETSGILIVAKTKKAFENLQAQFKKRTVRKKYTALAHGKVEPEKGSVNAPVGRLPWNRERFGVLPGGREAETRYRVISNFQFPISKRRALSSAYENLTLLELKPKTGRTHQIRIHLKYLGHPVVSDEFYAGRKTARADRVWCPRLFLHASEISFYHPKTGRIVSYKSHLPKDLKHALRKLNLS
ncbi:RluA family pseudouridine synthase [Patescibacteria group bacterium]|nr:RluA family pseudouridine synthase [Patescibacteria group bacterium]